MKKVRIIAILCALLLAAGLFVVLQKVDNNEEDTVNVVVAATDIAQNTVVTAEMLEVKAVPEHLVLSGTYSSADTLVGKVAKVDLKVGEQIISSRISEIGSREASNLAMMIEEGKRAITIAVDYVTGVSNMIHPGDMVDVLAHLEQEDGDETEKVTMTLVENVPVLAVDNIISNQGKEEYTSVTLMVTPEEANKIDWSENDGVLRVILRTPLDENAANAADVNISNVGK